MRLVFAGTPEVAVPALDAIAASRHELVGVVTRPDAPSGRGRKLVAKEYDFASYVTGLEASFTRVLAATQERTEA